MSFMGGTYNFKLEPTKTSVERYAGLIFGSERRPVNTPHSVGYDASL